MPIAQLVDKRDASEIIGDQIAKLLLLEVASQRTLARTAGKRASDWDLRVFRERTNPWSEFQDEPGTDENPDEPEYPAKLRPGAPLVNVWFDECAFEKPASNMVQRQRATGTYHIDCYALGVSGDCNGEGHEPGDQSAQLAAQRAAALVRNILMSSLYYNLGLGQPKDGGPVLSRWVKGVQTFRIPNEDLRAVQRIGSTRVTLEVSFYEDAPQVEGVPLEIISVEVRRSTNGQVLLTTQFGVE